VEWILQIAQEYGLFVALVIYVLFENKRREERYIGIIDMLAEEIKKDLKFIKSKIGRGGSE
jgi:hypothetical protein